jgi:REP element-mobilizing transposase RayT
MPRRHIAFYAESYYHLYNRGVNKETIFFEPDNYAFFLHRLRERFTPEAADVVAYCLLPNHYHLLVHVKAGNLPAMMQSFTMSYAKAINQRYGRVGPLFQGRFKGRLVDRDEYLLHLSCYIHLNPVRAGLVQKPEAWKYSSYPEYIGARNGSLPHPEIVLSVLGMPDSVQASEDWRTRAACIYRGYVETNSQYLKTIGHLLIED